jgi:uncharacterized protein YcaQ
MPRSAVPTLDQLRRHAVARSLFPPTTLPKAIARLGFVQADPMRAPARAQDLTLRHRVKGYRAGDLERRYPRLEVEEDVLLNYGFVPRDLLALLHPRIAAREWDAEMTARARDVLAWVCERGAVHPRDVQAAFDHGRTTSWGGTSTIHATTALLDGMHYRGLLRVARREAGTRVYEAVEHPPADDRPQARRERARALLTRVFEKYAPMPSASLGSVAYLLRYGALHLLDELRALVPELRASLPQAKVDGVVWLWSPDEDPRSARWRVAPGRARLLAPFDPVVWDRRRFELLWGWPYRFEAYTPAAKRTMGHYAMPLLWGDRVVGWGTAEPTPKGGLQARIGFVDPALAGDRALGDAIDEELADMAAFLELDPRRTSWRRARHRL